MNNYDRIDLLDKEETLDKEEFIDLLNTYSMDDQQYAAAKARAVTNHYFGRQIYIRGLIECTNYCKNDCYYCGIRKSNREAQRYRLDQKQILTCCEMGYQLGFRTFVLQGGEDGYYSDDVIVELILAIKENYPDCALTLSLGEKDYHSYQRFYQAGADRYLLRHETANDWHYQKLHPETLTLKNRKECLMNLKQIGFQTGCGGMIGSPGQTTTHLAEDLLFIHQLDPQMVGVGPFLPHHSTPFKDQPAGSLSMTLFFLSLVRIMQKKVLLPSTTALATLDPEGRKKGILAGANVVMPNLSPIEQRQKYMLYDNKANSGNESAQAVAQLEREMAEIGYEVISARGDYPG